MMQKGRVTSYFIIAALMVSFVDCFQVTGQIRQSSTQMGSTLQPSHGDPVLKLPLMEAQLSEETDHYRRHELEESINDAKIQAEFGIRKAQMNFYEAFSQQDMQAMKKVWSNSSPNVRCVHPATECIYGLDAIMESWEKIFSTHQPFTLSPQQTSVDVCGQTALCSCVEQMENGNRLECLNIYRREAEGWKMVCHMASPIVISQDDI